MNREVSSQNKFHKLRQMGALGGIVFVVLQVIAQAFIQIGGVEPPFRASTEAIVAFFATRNSQLVEASAFLSGISLLAFLWFLGTLWATLREAEGETAWLSLTAVMSGLMGVAVAYAPGGWELALFRTNDGLDPQIARLLFDSGNLAFANLWVFIASLLLAYAAVTLRTGVLPRWTGWVGIMIGVGLLIARAFWATSGIAFVPYMMFWLWLFPVSVMLLRKAGHQPEHPHLLSGAKV